MMKTRGTTRCMAVILALLLCALTAGAQAESAGGAEAAPAGDVADAAARLEATPEQERMLRIAGTYRYEGEGFGGDFTITLYADGTYAFYEGSLSSYLGGGTWEERKDAVQMTETNGFDLKFTFDVRDDALIYSAADSDSFPYVEVSDAARFVRQETAEQG